MTTSATITAAAALLQRELQAAIDTAGKGLSAAPAAARDLAARMAAQAADDARRASSGVTLNIASVEQRRAQINAEAAADAIRNLGTASSAMTAFSGIAARALAALREAADALADAERANVKEAARLKAESERLTELNATAAAQIKSLRSVGISI